VRDSSSLGLTQRNSGLCPWAILHYYNYYTILLDYIIGLYYSAWRFRLYWPNRIYVFVGIRCRKCECVGCLCVCMCSQNGVKSRLARRQQCFSSSPVDGSIKLTGYGFETHGMERKDFVLGRLLKTAVDYK
jgi:hypothetical protein